MRAFPAAREPANGSRTSRDLGLHVPGSLNPARGSRSLHPTEPEGFGAAQQLFGCGRIGRDRTRQLQLGKEFTNCQRGERVAYVTQTIRQLSMKRRIHTYAAGIPNSKEVYFRGSKNKSVPESVLT